MAGKRDQTKASEVSLKDIAIWLEALADQTDRMNDWEVGFLENVTDQFENGKLTDGQIVKLKEVYDKYY